MLTDFHSHILPGVDDGSSCLEESLQMLRMEAEQGVQRVVATPHFYARHDDPDKFLTRRNTAAAQLCAAIAGKDLPELVFGAEVHYFPGMSNSDILSRLTIEGKKYILIEMPMPPWSEKMYRELEGIYVKQGLIPIIAHIDRYIAPLQTHGIPRKLEDLPVLVQANASFFYGKTTARMAVRMLREGRIHLLGTDCHDTDSRKPDLGEAVNRILKNLGQQYLEDIRDHEQKLLENKTRF